jgi:hypothetical protein
LRDAFNAAAPGQELDEPNHFTIRRFEFGASSRYQVREQSAIVRCAARPFFLAQW